MSKDFDRAIFIQTGMTPEEIGKTPLEVLRARAEAVYGEPTQVYSSQFDLLSRRQVNKIVDEAIDLSPLEKLELTLIKFFSSLKK